MLDNSLYNLTENVNTIFAALTQHFTFDFKFWLQIIVVSQYILLIKTINDYSLILKADKVT